MKESMNIELAERVIHELAQKGIRSFCICPGGRLAPFVELLHRAKGLEILFFFEERSAGFFALGRTRRDQRPVAVFTTSGTAVAELLPSVIEAHYSGLPLVLVTSDRPIELGRHGAPQTLKNALEILKSYCGTSRNIVQPEDAPLSDWHPFKGSLHLNVCFDEPLIDQKIKALDFSHFKFSAMSIYPSTKELYLNNKDRQINLSGSKKPAHSKNPISKTPNRQAVFNEYSQLNKNPYDESQPFFESCKKPLLLIGELQPKEQQPVQNLLNGYRGLLYIEPLSNLQTRPGRLLSGERILNHALKTKEIDGVIRLGGIPRVRFWRDLEKHKIPVLHFSSPPFYRGLSRPSPHIPLLELDVLETYFSSLNNYGSALKDFDQRQLKKWKNILSSFPQSEESWFWTLNRSIKEGSKVFLGNSNPVRLWDVTAFETKKDLSLTGQAGVNGIEGLLSRFLGECESGRNNVGIIGDLSLLYDMAGFWHAKKLPPWTLIVINNYGGQIFSRLFHNMAFVNPHKLSFAPLADMWGLHYECHKNSSGFRWPKKPYNLLEIRPDPENSKNCFKKYVSIWDIP